MPGFRLDAGPLVVSTIAGALGTALLVYGKKQGRWPHLAAGALLLIYPYFVESMTALLAFGALIGAGLWWASVNDW
jgi:hypothetical protein